MANDGLITEIASKKVWDDLQRIDAGLLSILNHINGINASSKSLKLPSQISGATGANVQQLEKVIAIRQSSEKVIERERLAELKLQQQREQAFDKYEKSFQREQQRLAAAETLQAKTAKQIKVLDVAYTELSTRKLRYNNLTAQEEQRLLTLQRTLSKYRQIQDAVNVTVGKFQQRVGAYSTAFNPLTNSINQLTREAPAFAVSLNTGFLAISNNLPIFFDAIQQIVAQNKILQAEGKQTQSVFRQLMGSVFSFGTALSIGVTLLTLYGGEIVEWTKKLLEGSRAVDSVKESQSQLTSINKEATKSVVDDKIQLESWLKTASDVTLSYKEREIAANNVLKTYPFYFEALGKEKILNGEVAEAVKAVNDALLSRAKANAAVGKITENQSKIIDLEEERYTAVKRLDAAQASYNNRLKIYEETKDPQVNTALAQSEAELERAKSAVADIDEEINSLQEVNNRLTGYAINQTKQAIGLDYQSATAKKTQTAALKDFLATQYELNRLRLENEANIQQRIIQDEAQNLERRELAYKEYHDIQRQLAETALKETQRLNDFQAESEIKAIEKRIKEGEIRERNGRAVIASIRQDNEYKNLIAYENYAEALRQIDLSLIDSMKGVADAINFSKAEALINERDLNATNEYVDKLQQIVKYNKDYREIQKANKDFQIANRAITKANIQLEIDRINTELLGIKDTEANVQKRLQLNNELIKKQKELANVSKEEYEEQTQALEKLQKATESYLNSFKTQAFSDFGLPIIDQLTKIEENGKSVFENLIAGANSVEEKFAVAFNTSLEVAQQFYNTLQQYSNARFEREYAEAERSYKIATQFYGQTEEARAELERQYEEKRREIRRAELRAAKEQAIFNATINTAQGVTAALGQANYALAIIIGALGAAQIALIASQEIPAYKEGIRNAPGGLSLVGDGGRSEIIQTPSGNLYRTPDVDTLVNLPKGSNVYKSDADFLRNSGVLNTTPKVDWNGGRMPTAKEMAREIGNEIKNMPTSNTILHEGGFKSWVNKGHSREVKFNNKVQMKGVSVK